MGMLLPPVRRRPATGLLVAIVNALGAVAARSGCGP